MSLSARRGTARRLWLWVALLIIPVLGIPPLALPSPLTHSDSPSPRAVPLAFFQYGQPVQVTRAISQTVQPELAAQIVLEALLAGPTAAEAAQGIRSAFPAAAGLAGLQAHGEEVTVTVSLPPSFVETELDALASDQMVLQVVRTLGQLGYLRFHLLTPDPHDPAQLREVSSFLDLPAAPERQAGPDDIAAPSQTATVSGQPPVYGQDQPQGALSGRTVFVSAGHGWYWDGSAWRTLRFNTCDLVEDLSNAEAVDDFLIRYLWNAGADVWTVRERDRNTSEVIVDNDAGAPGYQESGTWQTSIWPGYGGGTYRYAEVAPGETATATWTPNLPTAGIYAVTVWYRSGANRATNARYTIHHAGGSTTVQVNQERDGVTWRYLGSYPFLAGTAGRVTLSNQSGEAGQVVIADAVRFGGGTGSIDYGGGPSGRPRYEESCLTWAPFQGAPPEVYPNDIVCRPRYAEWEYEDGEDAVYISWHSNGLVGGCSSSSGTGTETFIHNTLTPPGSAELQDWIHAEIIGDIRALWDADWVDRGQKTADLGELRELETIPGVLIEVAFHDHPEDADALRSADFRQLVARAVYQGLVRYYADRDGTVPHLLPEPPCGVAARYSGPGQVTVSWSPPLSGAPYGDPAEWYKIYVSTDGFAFDNGRVATDTQVTLTGLAADTLYFFRVTALNAGGESFPCLTAAVRTPPPGEGSAVLLVDGFDRLDSLAAIYEEVPDRGSVARVYLERMNSYSYAVQHGQALDACAVPFDFAANEALTAGTVSLIPYRVVDWLLGEESTWDETFSHEEQTRITAFLDCGGRLFLSGAEIGWDLFYRGDGLDQAFYNTVLRAAYLDDDAWTYQVAPLEGGIFDGMPPFFMDDSTHGAYDVDYPDRILPLGGSTVNLVYQGGLGGNAGLEYSGAYRLVYLAFPFETIYPSAARQTVMCRVMDFLDPASGSTACAVFLPLVSRHVVSEDLHGTGRR